MPVKVAIVGVGWWSQGWHLPQLDRHPDVDVVALVDASPHPKSNLNPDLESLEALAAKYKCQSFRSLEELLESGPTVDGLLIATPHATHYELGVLALEASAKRMKTMGRESYKPIHILMEKPMTTDVDQALALNKAVEDYRKAGGQGTFLVNHSANYRRQAVEARKIVDSGRIGDVRHVTAFFASPLCWIFEDPTNKGWNVPTGNMKGNGFAWGQSSHLLAWIFHACPNLVPDSVFCSMTHSATTGADVAHAASVTCRDGAVLSISGTSLLPGNAHSDPPVGKRLRMEIYGSKGALIYNGVDTDPKSGTLEFIGSDGKSETVIDSFDFEDLDQSGIGPASLQSWIKACQAKEDYHVGADCALGLKTVQVLSAMYESHTSKRPASVCHTIPGSKIELSS